MTKNKDEDNDFFEKMKKFLGINADVFDVDFLFLPDPRVKNAENFKDKALRVNYHFESGMDKPDIRIEGDFDKNKLKDYLKRMKFVPNSNIKRVIKRNKKKELSAKQLHLEPIENSVNLKTIEPFSELFELEDHIEILIEAPGVEKGHFLLSLSEDNKYLRIKAESLTRKFVKSIKLPAKCTMKDYRLDVNNGIATLKLNKVECI